MGQHSVPRGEKSSYGQANGSPQSKKDYQPKHGAAGSDVPARGQNVKDINTKKR